MKALFAASLDRLTAAQRKCRQSRTVRPSVTKRNDSKKLLFLFHFLAFSITFFALIERESEIEKNRSNEWTLDLTD